MAKRNTITFGRDTDGAPIAIVEDAAADALTAEADANEQAANDALAAMHSDPQLDPDLDTPDQIDAEDDRNRIQEATMNNLTVTDVALDPAEAQAHIANMRGMTNKVSGLTPRANPVLVDTHSPGPMAPHPSIDVNGAADRAEAKMRERLAKRAERDAALKAEATSEAAEMTADRKANPDKRAAASTKAAPKATAPKAEPKAKAGVCIFSGQPTGGGSFRPGYDAKLKGALIKAQRGLVPDLSAASPEMRQRFATGDLSTDEGRLAFAATRDWDKYLTPVTKTTAERTAKREAKATPDSVMDAIVDALMRLDWSEQRKLNLAADIDDAFQRYLREQDAADAEEEVALDAALAEPTPTGQPEQSIKEMLTEAGVDPSLNEVNDAIAYTQANATESDLTEALK